MDAHEIDAAMASPVFIKTGARNDIREQLLVRFSEVEKWKWIGYRWVDVDAIDLSWPFVDMGKADREDILAALKERWPRHKINIFKRVKPT